MATNDCIVHSRKNLSIFHTTVNQLRRENPFSDDVYYELPKRCCSCNGKTGVNVIDRNLLMSIHEEIASEKPSKPKSYTLTLSFEPEADLRDCQARMGRFIGKKGEKLNVLQDRYNILIYIKQNFPIRRVRGRRNFEREENNNPNELQLFIRRKDKSVTCATPIDKIKQDIDEQWEEASETRYIQRQYTFDQNQFQFVALSFAPNLSWEQQQDIMGRFIGEKGKNIRYFEDQYKIRLHIINDQSSNRKYFEKLIEVQKDDPDVCYIFITKKDKTLTTEISIEEVKEQIIQQWKQATIAPIDDEVSHACILSFVYDREKYPRRSRKKIGRFIGRNGEHLRDLQRKYNISIQIIDDFSKKKLHKKLRKVQNQYISNKDLNVLITDKNTATTNAIPMDKIEQDLLQLWSGRKQTTNADENQPLKLNCAPIECSDALEGFASATPEGQKQMLGECLFPLIQQMQPESAAKITGMILENDNAEIFHLLESRESLEAKVEEAIEVLQALKAT